MSHKMVSVKGLHHSYVDNLVLNNINLSIDKGEIFGILGPSGSGKTTLVKAIAGILSIQEGEIHIDKTKVPSLSLLQSIGYMAQSDALYHELTALENLEFFASIYQLERNNRKNAILHVLDLVNLSDSINKVVDQFSGGMKRRLSLASSLMHQPKLLILDEPTVGIDPIIREQIWTELRKLKNQGVTIIITTHVMDEAEKCDRLAMLRNGEIIACDTPGQLMNNSGANRLEDVFLAYGRDEQ